MNVLIQVILMIATLFLGVLSFELFENGDQAAWLLVAVGAITAWGAWRLND